MFRQIVSILLMCAVLTSHWAAAVPHSHAGMSPTERAVHNSVPHVHLGPHGNSGHGHTGHGHTGHGHTGHAGHCHQPGHDCFDRDDELAGLLEETIPASDDHGVPIYLGYAVFGGTFQSSVRPTTVSGELLSGLMPSSWSDWPSVSWGLDGGLGYDQPPEALKDGSSIYLLTRRLRL